MSDILKNHDELGNVFVQVQDDLRQLRRSLVRVTVQSNGETVDIQALDTAIRRTECVIRRREEQYLNTVNKQVLILPGIEDIQKQKTQISKWRPPLESIPDKRPQRGQGVGPSPGEKHKEALTMRLLYNPIHPQNRTVMHKRFGIQLPDLRQRSGTSVASHRVVTGPTVGCQAVGPGRPPHHLYPAPPLTDEDMRAGIASLLEKGPPPSAVELCLFRTPVQSKAAQLHPRDDSCSHKISPTTQSLRELTCGKDPGPFPLSQQKLPGFPAHLDHPHPSPFCSLKELQPHLPACSPQPSGTTLPPSTLRYHFTPLNPQVPLYPPQPSGTTLPPSTLRYHFTPLNPQCAAGVERLLRDYAVPTARVHGTRLVELVQVGDLDVAVGGRGGAAGGGGLGSRAAVQRSLISVLENREEVWELVQRPGQRYRGEGGVEAAATHIQSYWRCHVARASYLLHRRRRWAVGTIAISWLMHTQLGRVRGSLQESRRTHLENYRIRAQYLSANWKHIQSSRRTIIHIPSLGYSQSQRFSLKGFDILQNVQMGRLCDVRDDNVEVIYVSPVRLGDDLFQYYSHLIGLFQGAAVEPRDAAGPRVGTSTQAPMSKRFTILIPDALEDFPTHNMCLSSLLKYSPRTLRRIRHLIQGKQAYVVGGVTHVDDLAVADELEVPLLGPEPAVAQLYSTKSGGRRVFSSAGVAVPPGQWDVYSLQQLHEALARLMTNHILVRRWLFKMDSEMCGRGTAYCDVSHLRCFTWAQQVYSLRGPEMWRKAWAQESVLVKYLEEVPEWLARYARPVRPSCYPSWTCFLDTFLRHGGVVEAYPPSDSVTCLTVDLFLQPDGKVTMLSCGDQLHGPSDLETVGSSVPQNSVTPEDLYSVCLRVGRACLSRCITGHVSLDLATFLDPVTLDQQLWAIDLDLGYSNQLALTQLMLGTTGGSLDCRTSRLEVPLTSREAKPCPHPKGAKEADLPTVASRYAVLGNRLLHTNLSMVHYSVFFQMCKAQGIGFDIKEKQGTVFALHDSFERHSLGMVTICEDLQGALMAYVRNLSVIHQEISTPNMQGETNFKDLIREIEGVLGLTVQNKAQPTTEEDKMAVSLPGLN
ncbi:LOW QUALITY PROTEIN: IQ motif-containing protein H [Esox lucius]|uniref:LOW QUALITY PROTEIN: IQ motif-containing protein H n=1 Tax=Esox lucius TaxID=8010 RepID=UPI001477790D|nr:LOW QUALITY PROTEIN: IQ motif-containing protein H [Esox lucius]